MADENENNNGDEAAAKAEAEAAAAKAAEEAANKEDDEPKVYDQAYVKTLRDEAAANRVAKQKEAKLREDLEKKLKALEDAALSDEERAKQEFEDTRKRAESNESRARDLEVKYQLALAAADPANEIGDVKAAIKLLDRDSLDFDADGNITNLQDALETLKKEYPSVVRTQGKGGAPNTGVTNPAKPAGDRKYTRADLKTLSPEKIVELTESGKLNHLLGGK